MNYRYLIWIFVIIPLFSFGQKSENIPVYFSSPIITDSASTLMIPVKYNAEAASSSKFSLHRNYYANILFYNFITDTYKSLFAENTFIRDFAENKYAYNRMSATQKNATMSSQWVFYFVKPADFNQSGEIDEEDATVLYVSDKYGNGLKALTSVNENAVSLEMFDQQGFALIKMRRDSNLDSKFDEKDIEWYYIRLILSNLELGKPIVFEN